MYNGSEMYQTEPTCVLYLCTKLDQYSNLYQTISICTKLYQPVPLHQLVPIKDFILHASQGDYPSEQFLPSPTAFLFHKKPL